eukprot:COSAG03_NODE_38446_length_104_cov_66.200000_1_plen_20_part_10
MSMNRPLLFVASLQSCERER